MPRTSPDSGRPSPGPGRAETSWPSRPRSAGSEARHDELAVDRGPGLGSERVVGRLDPGRESIRIMSKSNPITGPSDHWRSARLSAEVFCGGGKELYVRRTMTTTP